MVLLYFYFYYYYLSEQICVSEYLYIGTYKYFYVSTFLEVVWRNNC